MEIAERRRHIGFRLKSLNHLLARRIQESVQKGGTDLTMMQSWIIGFLYRNRGEMVCQRDIEAAFHISRSSASGTLKLMEQKGYITRQSVPGDARLKQLGLTDLGLQYQKHVLDSIHAAEDLVMEGLTPEELDTFFALCDKIEQNLMDKTEAKEDFHAENHCVPDQGI